MANSIVSKGSTVSEAVELALELLNSTKNEVDIEIIDNGKKRMFGIGSKPAVVKVTKIGDDVNKVTNRRDSAQSDEEMIASWLEQGEENDHVEDDDTPSAAKPNRDENDLNEQALVGKVWIKDGVIYSKDGLNRYPVVTPTADVALYINQKFISELTIVKEHDQIEVNVEHETTDTSWTIHIEENKQAVLLAVEPGIVLRRTLIDQEPEVSLTLRVKTTKEVQEPVKAEAIHNRLNELNVVYGIDEGTIYEACHATEPGQFMIAKGKESIKGSDGWIDYKTDMEEKAMPHVEREDGTTDFRETQYIPVVSSGAVIGVVHPAEPGIPGINVHGEEVAPPPSLPIVVRAGKGASYIEDLGEMIATGSGRPKIDKQGQMVRVSIMPKLYHDNDVNLSTGNIHFIGDVEIIGNVEEGMEVEAEGDIIVHENANTATLVTTSSIIVKTNVINSELTAGKSNILIAELAALTGELNEHLHKIIQAVQQLQNTPAFKQSDIAVMGLSSLLKILLDQKFKSFLPLVKEMVLKINSNKKLLDKEWHDASDKIQKGFLVFHPEGLKNVNDLTVLLKKLERLHEVSVLPPESNARVTFPYALNSTIFCSGDIFVHGKGCYNSKIHAGGKLFIQGALLGGETVAQLGADIVKVGSNSGIQTKITVPYNQTIKIGVAMEDTIVQVGKKIHKFTEESHNVHARIDKNDRLLLY